METEEEKRSEFERLFNECQKNIERYCVTLCRNSHISPDDLLAETLIRAWTKFNHFQPGTNFLAWLMKIARNILWDMIRSTNRERAVIGADGMARLVNVPTSTGDPFQTVLQADTRAYLWQAVAKLPPRQSALVTLYYLHGHSQEECARILAIPHGSVKNTLSRARISLRQCLPRDLIV